MRRTLLGSFATAALLLPSLPAQTLDSQAAEAKASDAQAWAPHRALKVLYAGKEGGHREKVFAQFLAKWFDESGTIPLAELSMETAAGYDVVIADWVSQYGNDGYPARSNSLFSPPISLDPSFTKPVISMSYVASSLRRGYKIDWL